MSDSVPQNVKSTVESIADLHAEHYMSLPPSQLQIEALTERIGKPAFFFACLGMILVWMVANLTLWRAGGHPVDPPPFYALQGVLTIAAFLMTIIILTASNRQGALDERRAQLTLQIGMISEAKLSKVIEMLDRMSAEHPLLTESEDHEIKEMQEPADPRRVLDTLDRANASRLSSEQSESR